ELADDREDVQVPGRVVVEEVPAVEAVQALAGEVLGPELERQDVDLEPGRRAVGMGQEVCDDEPEGEPRHEEAEDGARAAACTGSWRSAPTRVGLTGCGACQPRSASCGR